MNTSFSKDQQNLLDQNIIAIVSVLSPKGMPYLTPIWFTEDNNKIYFSTMITRTKGKFLTLNNNIGINITHPDGGPYVSIVGKAIIQTREKFSNYDKIVQKIFDRYVKNSEKDKMMQDNLNNRDRILVEITPIRVFG